MSFIEYVKEKLMFIVINIVLMCILILIQYLFHASLGSMILVVGIWVLPLTAFFIMDYMKKRKFYTILVEGVKELDKKYLLQNIITEPDFLEGRIIFNVLTTTNKSMHEEINEQENQLMELNEFIELWVHEIKTPIAASKLILQNQDVSSELKDELQKIEDYVEEVLYYARSKEAEKDYIVKELEINHLIRDVIKKNARSFVAKKIQVNIDKCSGKVYSDGKWLEFILGQIVNNSIQYSKDIRPKLSFYTREDNNKLVLTIEDNGIGINAKDLPRVFHKGFTGENGRNYKKSTGIGLYLCKQLANKLYMGLEIESTINVGTKIHIIFPKDKNIIKP